MTTTTGPSELDELIAYCETFAYGEDITILSRCAKAMRSLRARLEAAEKGLLDTTCQEHADHWKKRAETAQAEAARLKAGGCARDQRTTQWCAEAEALREDAERLKQIGYRMSNICFNLGQHEDTKLDADARRCMRQCQKEWDAAARKGHEHGQG